MPKEFYTERDIEDMFKRGIQSLRVDDNVVLTELAYEKAQRLGMQLTSERPIEVPSAPIRPYLSQDVNPAAASAAPIVEDPSTTARIREAVSARLGTQVDPQLLEVIIQRVLKNTGVK